MRASADPALTVHPAGTPITGWAAQGISEAVHAIALQAYDRMIGLELSEISVDGSITKLRAAASAQAGPRSSKRPSDRWDPCPRM